MSDHNVSRQAVGRNQLYKNFLIVSLFLLPTFHYTYFKKKKKRVHIIHIVADPWTKYIQI